MKTRFLKILKYEFLNILRNKWMLLYICLLSLLSMAFLYLGGDIQKAVVSLMSVLSVLVPLVTLLFTIVYWYHSESFTHTFLTQPLHRKSLFVARWMAMGVSLSVSLIAGILPIFIINGGITGGLLLSTALSIFLTLVFESLGLWVAITLKDRMKGIGLGLGIWLYFALLHDGAVLLLLLNFREYSMDLPSALLSSLNPIGISRVALMMYYDISLLLSHSGMLIRNLLTSWKGEAFILSIGIIWLFIPAFFSARKFMKRDL